MGTFLDIVFSFPTVIYTAIVGLSIFFWMLVIAGGMGIEFFDFDVAVDAAAEEAGYTMAEFLSALGVGTVPFSIMLTVFAFWGWIMSYVGTLAIQQVIDPPILLEFGLLIAVTAVTVPLTGLVTYPTRQLFDTGGNTTETLTGSVCEITTSRVDEDFGRASVYHNGADLVLSVRCDGDNSLGRGDEALILQHDEAADVYWVEPYDDLLSGSEPDDLDVDDVLDDSRADGGTDTAERKDQSVAREQKARQTQQTND